MDILDTDVFILLICPWCSTGLTEGWWRQDVWDGVTYCDGFKRMVVAALHGDGWSSTAPQLRFIVAHAGMPEGKYSDVTNKDVLSVYAYADFWLITHVTAVLNIRYCRVEAGFITPPCTTDPFPLSALHQTLSFLINKQHPPNQISELNSAEAQQKKKPRNHGMG